MINSQMEILEHLQYAERYFPKSPEFRKTVESARRLFDTGAYNSCELVLKRIPTVGELTERLISKLRGKSVYKSVKVLLREDRDQDPLLKVKASSSLLTHAAIEAKTRPEYVVVMKTLLEALNSLVFEL